MYLVPYFSKIPFLMTHKEHSTDCVDLISVDQLPCDITYVAPTVLLY